MKFRVKLHPVPAAEIEAENTDDAIGQYKAMMGIISTVNPFSVDAMEESQEAVASEPVPAADPVTEEQPAPAEAAVAESVEADPSLADMGIDGEAAEALVEAGLLTRSAIEAYAAENGDLVGLPKIGRALNRKIMAAVESSRA